MTESIIFVGLDSHKERISVALAESTGGRELRYLGEIANTTEVVCALVDKLAHKDARLEFCYEAGPCGYGLYRQITGLGHGCMVVAPSLIPRRPGERVKTNRRDAEMLARLHRAGELTAVWVPDPAHEAMRDLVRAREAACEDLRRARQRLGGFLLRHGRISIWDGADGPRRTVPGWGVSASTIAPSRSCSRIISRPSMMPPGATAACSARSRRCFRVGRWRRWWTRSS